MTAEKPTQAREPDCIHSGWSGGRRLGSLTQPASACIECQHGPELRQWRESWAAWLAENPDSPEARWVAEMDKRYPPGEVVEG